MVLELLALLKPLNVEIVNLVDDAERASKGGWVLPASHAGPGMPRDLYGVYKAASNGEYEGRATAPLMVEGGGGGLVSNESNDILVSNESNDILRLLQTLATTGVDLRPEELSGEIDGVNEWGYRLLQNGVYKCGFATTQLAYDEAAAEVLEGLRRLDDALGASRFCAGDKVTEADVKMYPWACRFDGAYSVAFKAPGGKIGRWENIRRWKDEMGRIEGVRGTVDVRDAVGSYYRQLFMNNPSGIVFYDDGWGEEEEGGEMLGDEVLHFVEGN
ncbi:hypothetical protein TrRE_jg13186 [Triparma retinervis]|uniref:GST C-terminal domain-containing protein n=1 Tax=Triparma retinervis TaxID=2557542 RepID=A0A9W7CJ33_9STRA|nr:hypothetical protein TrRE_jg13186 [Triparma retinervis]